MRSVSNRSVVMRFLVAAFALVTTHCAVGAPAIAQMVASAGPAHYRLHGLVKLPDSVVTPGVVLTTDTARICRPGYAATQRHTSRALKAAVFRAYGVRQSLARPYEIDHVISLELGGADVVGNLFAQPYFEHPGAHEKDILEHYLHAAVCAGALDVTVAQRALARDWYAAAVQYLGGHQAVVLPPVARGR